MISRKVRFLLVTSSLALLLPGLARAQFEPWRAMMESQPPAKETISGVGMVTVRQTPTALRMYVELLGKGKTLEAALANLKDRREAALAQLQSLGARKESIWFSSPGLSNIQSAQQRQLEQMIRQRLVARGRKLPRGLQVARPVVASVTLTAEWPLPAGTPEKLLVAAEALKEKLRAADLAGSKEAEKLSPEEQELAEEMAEMLSNSGEQPVPLGEPHFVYVARISDQDRDKALAEAFAKARAQASRLARAAGIGLGPLVGLSGQGGGVTSFDGYEDPFGGYSRRAYIEQLIGRRAASDQAQGDNEAIGPEPGSLSFGFYVRAIFGMQKRQ